MDKCDQLTAVECVDRIMAQFEKPIGLDSKARMQEMITLFGEHSVQAARSATNTVIRKFKKLPTPAHLADLLTAEDEHVRIIDQQRPRKPSEEWTEQEIFNGLLHCLNHNFGWPGKYDVVTRYGSPDFGNPVWTERGLAIVPQVTDEFLRTMDPHNNAHLLAFHRLRTGGWIPMNTPLPRCEPKRNLRREHEVDEVLRKHGWVQIADAIQGVSSQRKPKQSDIAKLNALCKEYDVDPAAIKDAKNG